MNQSGAIDAEVLVVGGGPVGFGLAIDLALRGVSVQIVERHETIQRIPKGQNLTQRTGEHFRRWGVTRGIQEATPIPREFGNAGMTAYGSLLSKYHHDWFNRSSVAPYYAAENERLPQYETEKVLRARAQELDKIKVLTGWTYTSHKIDGDLVTVDLQQTRGSETKSLKGHYLVGTDGANSAVREAAGITLDTHPDHMQKMALLVFQSKELDELLSDYKGKTIYNALNKEMKGYWQFLGRVDLDGNWFFHAPVPADAQVDTYDFNSLLYNAVGASFAVEFEYVGFWDLRLCVANQYSNGRVFIAGDAAHSHPPYGGYGVNTGFEDARNLSWKLAAAVQGWAGPHLLDSYTPERKPVFESVRDHFILRMINEDAEAVSNYDPDKDLAAFEAYWEKRSSGEDVDVTQFLPNIAGSTLVFGPVGGVTSARGEHLHTARAGYHLSPQKLSDGTDVYDRLGGGLMGDRFSLIAIDQPADVLNAFEQAAEELKVPLELITSEASESTANWQARLILVRPDEFIAYAADPASADDLHKAARDIIARAVGY